ncbi:hypothetical protein [Aeromicrobium choanae]|uniref:Carboxypeptidase regulatory-like domain-containing protein n=1 Tax=Aeromicrobium choanae TaxID=1736691 RepID=A0A1T4Z2K8_9ACTN|nr:hypothetical protein [Aeromicrobium choanae]SKB08270.1 hypothetical protein SAMN06295964_2071 [Aeromicrobium choanae]
MKNMTRAALVAVLALVASLLLAPTGIATAAPAAVGTISGRVTGGPAGAGTVTLHRLSAEGRWTEVASVHSSATGAYALGVTATGTYQVRAKTDYDFTHAAAPSRRITVSKGAKVTGVDLALVPNPTVAGTITTTGFGLEELQLDPNEGRLGLRAAVWGLIDGQWERYGSTDLGGAYYGPWVDVRTGGAYTVPVPGYYDAVRLQFYQPHCNDPIDCEPFGAAPVALRAFWNGTDGGAATLEEAADLDVSSGSVVDKDITLQAAPQLRVVARPTISGDPSPGGVLTAAPGTLAPVATGATYTWIAYSGDEGSAVGTGRTFTVTPSLLGKELTVHVLPSRAGHEAPLLKASNVTVKSRSRFAVKAKAGQRKATVTIAIKAPGVATSRIHGKASIYAKGKRIKTVNVKNGKATIKIAKQKKGKRTYTVRYSGNRIITSSTKSLKIAIR